MFIFVCNLCSLLLLRLALHITFATVTLTADTVDGIGFLFLYRNALLVTVALACTEASGTGRISPSSTHLWPLAIPWSLFVVVV